MCLIATEYWSARKIALDIMIAIIVRYSVVVVILLLVLRILVALESVLWRESGLLFGQIVRILLRLSCLFS